MKSILPYEVTVIGSIGLGPGYFGGTLYSLQHSLTLCEFYPCSTSSSAPNDDVDIAIEDIEWDIIHI